jgi:hypothetical protein
MIKKPVLCYNNQVETGLLCGFLFKNLNSVYNFTDARYLFCAASAGLDPEQVAGVNALSAVAAHEGLIWIRRSKQR